MNNKLIIAISLLTYFTVGCQAPTASESMLLDDTLNEKRATYALNTKRVVRLADNVGDTFFQVMMEQGGIIDLMTEDQDAPFLVKHEDDVLKSLNETYTTKVIRKVGSQSSLAKTVRSLRGEQGDQGFSTNELKGRNIDRAQLEILGMASGAGVKVEVDDDNFFYNISYVEGERKPGRSYGVGPARKSDDTSYPDYFDRLADHLELAGDKEIETLFEATFRVLTASDASAVDEMNKYGENLFTDFITVYVAEAYRKLTGGSGGSFHQDLTETTILSVWSQVTGKIPTDAESAYEIVDGSLKGFINRSENGSGLGFNKNRRRLQKQVCEAVRKIEPAIIEAMENITGSSRSYDCIQTTSWFLNNPSSQAKLKAEASNLTKAVVNFVMFIRANGDDILAKID